MNPLPIRQLFISLFQQSQHTVLALVDGLVFYTATIIRLVDLCTRRLLMIGISDALSEIYLLLKPIFLVFL